MRNIWKSKQTEKAVRYALRRYEAFTPIPLAELTEADAISFYHHLTDSLCPSSIYLIFRLLSLLTPNKPFKHLYPLFRGARKPSKPAALIPFDKVQSIVELTDCIMDKVILALLFGLGVRTKELLDLDIKDVSETKVILRQTKTRPVFVVYIPYYLRPLMAEYLASLPPTQVALFKTHRSNRASYHYVYRLFTSRCAILNIKASPHAGRATTITKLLSDGVPLEVVSAAVGHSSIQTTLRYDRRRREELAKKALLTHAYP